MARDLFSVLHHLQNGKENISISPLQTCCITKEPDYYSRSARVALLENKFEAVLFFFFLNSPIYENFNHYKTFKKYKLTPKSQHDILTVINCCSLCQGSAHQQLAVAGIGHASCHCSTTSLQTLPSFQLARRISSIAPKHTAHIFSYLVEGLSVHFLSICKR